ncbi:hypothetical protein Holit_01432 [Hollandina sp. SP2]
MGTNQRDIIILVKNNRVIRGCVPKVVSWGVLLFHLIPVWIRQDVEFIGYFWSDLLANSSTLLR